MLNAPGTIDADYRGEVQVLLVNLGAEAVAITRGMRIAQLVVATVARAQLREVALARRNHARNRRISALPEVENSKICFPLDGWPTCSLLPLKLQLRLVPIMPLVSRKGILAIAAVIDIAIHARSRPVSAKALAARHKLPPRHLEPVLQALVRDGILRGVRGPHGGYELAREHGRISAEDILRAAGARRGGRRSAAARLGAGQ